MVNLQGFYDVFHQSLEPHPLYNLGITYPGFKEDIIFCVKLAVTTRNMFGKIHTFVVIHVQSATIFTYW